MDSEAEAGVIPEGYSEISYEVYNPELTPWEAISEDILHIDASHFKVNEYTASYYEMYFINPLATIVLMKNQDSKAIIGFTYTIPAESAYRQPDQHNNRYDELKQFEAEHGKSAYIMVTAIDKGFMGRHLVGGMKEALEVELVKRGYTHVESDAAVANNFAANTIKTYTANGRLVAAGEPHESENGPQRFIRIRLPVSLQATPSPTSSKSSV